MKLNFYLLTVLLICFLGSTSIQAQSSKVFEGSPIKAPIQEDNKINQQFADFDLFLFDSKKIADYVAQSESSEFSFKLNSEMELHFTLEKNEIRAAHYKLRYINENGISVAPRSACVTYKGTTADGGKVRATIKAGYMTFMIVYSDRTLFLENANRFSKTFNDDVYVWYEAEDAKRLSAGFCAVTDIKKKKAALRNHSYNRSSVPSGCVHVDLAIASDYLMWQKHGANTQTHNLTVMNNVATDYDSDFNHDIEYTIVEQFVSTSSGNAAEAAWGASTDVTVLLPNFRSWGNSGGFSNPFDLGQWWTDRDFNGSTVGYAYNPGVCGTSKYHILQDYTTNANNLRVLTSHEIGHNWSCNHDAIGSTTIMAPSVNNTTTWSQNTIDEVNAREGSIACGVLSGAPSANFEINTTECKNTPIALDDLSTRSPSTWAWTMSGGTPSSASNQNTSVIYSTIGSKTVSLTSTNTVCAGASSGVQSKTFQVLDMQGPASACTIGLTNANTSINYTTGIQGVQLDALNHTSGSTHDEGVIYKNRSCEQFISLSPGTYPITVTVGTINTERLDVYIDFNNNGVFTDPNELVVNNVQSSGGTISSSIVIPSTGVVEDVLLRMRVMTDIGPISNSCQTPTYGQVEDFGIIVPSPGPPPCTPSLLTGVSALVLDSTRAAVIWDVTTEAGFFKVQYREMGTSTWTLVNVPNRNYQRVSTIINGLSPNTTYQYRARMQCPDLSVGSYTSIQSFTTFTNSPCAIPAASKIVFMPDPDKVRIFIDYEPEGEKFDVRWRVLGTTQPIDNKVFKKSTSVLTGLTPSTDYEYRVRTKCSGVWTGYSSWTTFTTNDVIPPLAPPSPSRNSFDEGEFAFSQIQLYPNPANQTLYIEVNGQNEKHLRIMDLSGRVIVDKFTNENMEVVDISSYPSGTYFCQVIHQNGQVITQKFIRL